MLSLKCSARSSKELLTGRWDGGFLVARALRNHNVWLVLTWLGLILLMARTYA